MKPLKQLERYVSALFTMGRVKVLAKEARRGLTEMQSRVDHLEDCLTALARDLQDLQATAQDLQAATQDMENTRKAAAERMAGMDRDAEMVNAKLKKLLDWKVQQDGFAEKLVLEYRRETATLQRLAKADTAMLARMFTALSARLDQVGQGDEQSRAIPPVQDPAPVSLPDATGFALFKDSFYQRLSGRTQYEAGHEEEVLTAYLADVESACQRTDQLPVMDLGCGQGRWLAMLAERGMHGFGVDHDAAQVAQAREAGRDVRHADALAALADQKDASLSVITAHHLTEHLPFDAVAWMVREAMRVLAPGGMLILALPNPGNLTVVQAALSSLSPLRLLSEQVLETLFKTAGFDPVETRPLNPDDRLGAALSQPGCNAELAFMMLGPRDLAVLGTRPQEA